MIDYNIRSNRVSALLLWLKFGHTFLVLCCFLFLACGGGGGAALLVLAVCIISACSVVCDLRHTVHEVAEGGEGRRKKEAD